MKPKKKRLTKTEVLNNELINIAKEISKMKIGKSKKKSKSLNSVTNVTIDIYIRLSGIRKELATLPNSSFLNDPLVELATKRLRLIDGVMSDRTKIAIWF